MKKFLIRENDFNEAKRLVSDIRSLIRQRKGMLAIHSLNKINDILLNAREAPEYEPKKE